MYGVSQCDTHKSNLLYNWFFLKHEKEAIRLTFWLYFSPLELEKTLICIFLT